LLKVVDEMVGLVGLGTMMIDVVVVDLVDFEAATEIDRLVVMIEEIDEGQGMIIGIGMVVEMVDGIIDVVATVVDDEI